MAKVDPKEVVARLRKSFRGGKTRSLRFRREQLRATIAMVKERESAFLDALRADLRKPQTEGWVSDLGLVASEAEFALDHLEEWAAPEKVKVPLVVHPARAQILREPYGVTLNISPWNYPIELALGPMISAVAAGNCMVMKPSEITPHCSAALAEWVPQYLDDDCIAVVEGAVPETTALLEERFDYIFYTGNENVGRIVMTAAAKNLTPVTLELGGKSPCFVDHHVDLGVAARRIAWGKFFNAGQTC
ncbi:MAG: aldehyde dehydrogenase family protein, partial [Myxococcales bacterium]|nr:aldehyde dehydrogenase family protein [Myxococcales bacterium]